MLRALSRVYQSVDFGFSVSSGKFEIPHGAHPSGLPWGGSCRRCASSSCCHRPVAFCFLCVASVVSYTGVICLQGLAKRLECCDQWIGVSCDFPRLPFRAVLGLWHNRGEGAEVSLYPGPPHTQPPPLPASPTRAGFCYEADPTLTRRCHPQSLVGFGFIHFWRCVLWGLGRIHAPLLPQPRTPDPFLVHLGQPFPDCPGAGITPLERLLLSPASSVP